MPSRPKKHGSWYYAHELPPDQDGRRRQTKQGGFPTEKAARTAMQDALATLSAGTWIDFPKITVGEYLDEWLAGKASLRPTTHRSYRGTIDLYLKPALGRIKLADLRHTDIERLYAAMRELGAIDELGEPEAPLGELARRLVEARSNRTSVPQVSAARVKRVHATLMSALNAGVKRRRLPVNPGQHVEVPVGRRPRAVVWTAERIERWKATGERPPVAMWTAQQTGCFLDSATTYRLYPVYHLIAYRGLRRGEALGVRWIDVDLAGGALAISQQIVQLGWEIMIGAPKTVAGERTVSLDDGSVEVLKRWQERQSKEREGCGDGWQDTGLVFTREDGSPLQPESVSTAFGRIAEEAGLPPIRLHDVRHTAASLAS